MSNSNSDKELWERASGGDRLAFGELFRLHYTLLYQYGTKIQPRTEVVEDAIQELFSELWQKRSDTPVRSVKAYLLQAIKFKLYKNFRDGKDDRSMEDLNDEPFEISHEHLMISRQEDAERNRRILQSLNLLPPRQKEIIYLKVYKGLSYEEVSAIMGMNYQVVRNLLYQALKTFRSNLE